MLDGFCNWNCALLKDKNITCFTHPDLIQRPDMRQKQLSHMMIFKDVTNKHFEIFYGSSCVVSTYDMHKDFKDQCILVLLSPHLGLRRMVQSLQKYCYDKCNICDCFKC